MYRLLGDEVIDTDELIEMLEANGIRVAENVTNATKRDDAIGLRFFVPIVELDEDRVDYSEEQMERLMQKAQSLYEKKLGELLKPWMVYRAYAYSYNEVERSVVLNVVIMDQVIGHRKIDDVLKRLFDV